MKSILKYALILYTLIGALVAAVITALYGNIWWGLLAGAGWLIWLIYGLISG